MGVEQHCANVDWMIQEMNRINGLRYEELQEEFKNAISLSSSLGKKGWTVDGSKCPNYISDWLSIVESKGEAALADFFSEHEIEQAFDNIESRYIALPERWYIGRARDNYYGGKYAEAAVFLLGVLDYRVCKITPERFRKKKDKCTKGLIEQGKAKFEYYEKRPLFRQFVICNYLPSFSSFMTRLFVDDEYDFGKGIEPPYLNRNWLLHGRHTRNIKRYECVQLIHSFSTLADIEDWIQEDNEDE